MTGGRPTFDLALGEPLQPAGSAGSRAAALGLSRMKRRPVLRRSLLIVGLASSPLVLVSALGVINLFNPMVLAFQYEFEVVNHSGEPVAVTPIGAVGPSGARYVLPQYSRREPALPALRRADFVLLPGESIKVIYDWDDINFSEILVHTTSGHYRQLVIDPNPTESQYHPPKAERYVVPPLAELREATPSVIRAASVFPFNYRAWLLLLSGPVPVLVLLAWWRLRRIEAQSGAAVDARQSAAR